MSNISREGWHPKGKDGGRESWRGDFKGINQVAGWVGKGRNPEDRSGGGARSDHISRPLATLKDPTSFGPPPKNVNFHGGAALPNQITPDRQGLGAPLAHSQLQISQRVPTSARETEGENQVRPPQPRLPSRPDRTESQTKILQPPPPHSAVQGSSDIEQDKVIGQGLPFKSKPSLPPRLPPRSNSSDLASPTSPSSPPPTYTSVVGEPRPAQNAYLNQGAVDRLGKAGLSVPSLGIGQKANTGSADRSTPRAQPSLQLSELQSRFSRISTKSDPASTRSTPQSPGQGTTFAQKQSALNTAHSFHKDPSSVSLADAQSAASTANNFRERHHEQVAAGARKASSFSTKYNITGRVNGFVDQHASPQQQQLQPPQLPPPQQQQRQLSTGPVHSPNPTPTTSQNPETQPPTSDLSTRKPPPPPPPKRPGGTHAPPPVPLGTKPSFG